MSQLANEANVELWGLTAGGATVISYDSTLTDEKEITFDIEFGTVSITTATCFIRCYQASISDFSDAVEVTALKEAIVAGMDSKHVIKTLTRPTKKYIRFQADRTGASNSIAIVAAVAIKRLPRVIRPALETNTYSRSVAIGN